MNNTDFDSDEVWMYKPITADGVEEMTRAMDKV